MNDVYGPTLDALKSLSRIVLSIWILPCVVWIAADVHAQAFSYRPDRAQAVQSVSAGLTMVEFRFDGEGDPDPSFEYSGPLYGVVYTRPNLHVTLGYGVQNDVDLRMLDASLTTWGEFRLTGSEGFRLYVPIVLHSNYRRVAPEGSEDSLVDAFNVTVVGLGSGLGLAGSTPARLAFEARVMPVIGLALHAFGDSAGSSRLVDTHLQLHSPAVIGRVGLSAGYGLRVQVWNVGSSSLFPVTHDDLLDYSGTSHSLSIGVNW